MTDVVFTKYKHLGVITLARVNALNALSFDMIKNIYSQLKAWEEDNSIQAVLIKSAHEKVFCAGGDVRSLYANRAKDLNHKMEFFWHEYRLNHLIYSYKKPYIAFLNGLTMGGGVGVSLHGSFPIATENFSFAMPETNIGFFPDIGASYFLSDAGGLGLYLGLTGARLDAGQALEQGFIKAIVAAKDLECLEEKIIEASTVNNEIISNIVKEFETQAPKSSYNLKLLEIFSEPSIAKIFASLKESKELEIMEIYKNLDTKSPLSLMVTFEQMQRAKGKKFEECLVIDYNLAAHFMSGSDFYEGVRALLIDKDKNPLWQFKDTNDIDVCFIDNYFKPLNIKTLTF